MKTKIFVVADLGRFRAFRIEQDPRFSNPHLELLEDWKTNVHGHLSQEVTDQGGQFRKGSATGGDGAALSDHEQHNLDLERRSRAVKRISRRIVELLKEQGVEECYLAADTRLNSAVTEELDPQTLSKIQNMSADLSNFSHSELIQRISTELSERQQVKA